MADLSMDGCNPAFLAPYMTINDEKSGAYECTIEHDIVARFNDSAFTVNATPDTGAVTRSFNLVLSGKSDVNAELSIDDLIKKQFGHPDPNPQWKRTIEDNLAQKRNAGRRNIKTDAGEDSLANSRPRDDLFTVRIDNLPEGTGPDMLKDLFRENGCDYFSRIVVPRNDDGETFKRFGFVKFEHLRHALIFCEQHNRIRCGQMVINAALAI